MSMAEVDDIWKLLILLENILNFALGWVIILAIVNINKSQYLNQLILFQVQVNKDS